MAKRVISDVELSDAVKTSKSVTDVLRKLGVALAGGSHKHFSTRIKNLGLDTSHFQLGTKGQISRKRLSADEILVYDRVSFGREHSHKLKRALLELGRPYVCGPCNSLPIWNGIPLDLEVDHIDGDSKNNLRENLRFICPNCHSQTPTFKNKKRS